MELELQKASQFQDYVYSLVEYVDYIPYKQIQISHILITVILVVSSLVSYRLGKKKESKSLLSEKFKKKLDEFEQDAYIIKRQIEDNEELISKALYIQILCFVMLSCYLVYQGLIDYTDNKMIIAGVILVVLVVGTQMYKNHLISKIKKLNYKILEDQNQQDSIMHQLISEMSDKTKNILGDIMAKKIMKECELEKDSIKKIYEQKIKSIQSESEVEKDSIKKKFETRIQSINQQHTQEKNLCKAHICKKKRKLLREKLKRSDWFIRNLSEFAWCSICASNMYEDPLSQSFINDNPILDQTINLDDSIMLNTTLADESPTEEDDKLDLFNKLNSSSKGEVIRKECESNCLSKYFFLCKKIGEKYNEWSALIEKFESKYKQEKQKLKQQNGQQQ